MRTIPALILCLGCQAALAGESINVDRLTRQLEAHEGKSAVVYKDSRGIPTIGVGFNLQRTDARRRIEKLGLKFDDVLAGKAKLSDGQIRDLLQEDVRAAVQDAKSLVKNFDDLSEARKRVLADMAFNLGRSGLAEFRKMLKVIEGRDFAAAAREMDDSRWAGQVKGRARTLSKMMRDGK